MTLDGRIWRMGKGQWNLMSWDSELFEKERALRNVSRNGECIEQVVVDRGVWELCDGCEKIDWEGKAAAAAVVVKWRILDLA